MSHYTVGIGSRPDLRRYARQADKARSAALMHALAWLAGRIRNGWLKVPRAKMDRRLKNDPV